MKDRKIWSQKENFFTLAKKGICSRSVILITMEFWIIHILSRKKENILFVFP